MVIPFATLMRFAPRRGKRGTRERFMSQTSTQQPPVVTASNALTFVLMMGVVNLFADMTYEGASSINGPFLGSLGASAAAIGVIVGVGEFLGYSLRFMAGY